MTTFNSHFTQDTVSKIILPKTKQDFYNDTKEKGLFLIASKRSKTFYLRKTVEKKGRSRTINLGRFPYISVLEARNKAAELKNQIAKGINPLEKLAITNNPIDDKLTKLTVKEFFDKYIEEHCKRKNKGWKSDIAKMTLYGKDYYEIKISTVTMDDIQKTFNNISNNRGIYSANNFLKLFSAMFNRGIRWQMLDKNPAKDIEKNLENVRERYIATQEELSRFINVVIEKCTRIIADVILMLLFTGARKSNVFSMKWQDINFENMTWSIPAKSAKNNKTQRVHLVNSALRILTGREKENNNKSIWVFPSDQSKSGHIASPDYIWQKICKLAGIEDLRIHDLRRTHGSWMRKVGADREIIAEALGHKDQRSTGVYDIIGKEQVREFQDKSAVPLDKILEDLGFFPENEVTMPKETKIADNIEANNTIEALQSQIKAQQKMIEELTQQITK
ncbi:tyrosine-type recombinase/integrase [Candidatus Tisiphia endosymbiont of Hybos culiciformis]|uniref:tyrosine-type recombinase/integrase n=1 Tax=Candidatus Tisiphia endosymbiont of Hybos culiciformis TaxID=3139331 RepID=UPI003CCB0380